MINMMTAGEMDIINVFRQDIFGSYTIHAVMKKAGRKTYTWTFNTTKKLAKTGIIKMETKGKSRICGINLYNKTAISYLSLLDETEAASKKLPNIDRILNEVPTPFFTLIVGGSYAEGKQTPKSDLDICVIVDDKSGTKPIKNRLDNMLLIPALHTFVFKRSEFLKMLTNREMNYGKMLFKKSLIVFGAESYYLIIREAIENGFRG